MDLDTNRIRELLDKRDEIDQELMTIIGGTKEKKAIKCGACGEEGHSSRTCSKKVVQQ